MTSEEKVVESFKQVESLGFKKGSKGVFPCHACDVGVRERTHR